MCAVVPPIIPDNPASCYNESMKNRMVIECKGCGEKFEVPTEDHEYYKHYTCYKCGAKSRVIFSYRRG